MKKVNLYGYEIYENGTILRLNGKKPMAFHKTIEIVVNGEIKSVSYARLVYYAFHQDFDFENYKLLVHHKDNNYTNNAIDNLYVTNAKKHLRGKNHPRSKLTDEQIKEIKMLYEKGNKETKGKDTNYPFKKVSYRKLAQKYGVSHNLIKEIVKGGYRGNNWYSS